MKRLAIFQILELHRRLIKESEGISGVRDFGALVSALARPEMTFEGKDLYPTLVDKASALAHSICMNHPFVDGNKRVAHAAMEIFLVLNGFELNASVDEQERLFLELASGNVSREELANWPRSKVVPILGAM